LYLEEIEKDENVGISVNGYEKLLVDLKEQLPKSNEMLKREFELQEENVLRCDYLLDFNIKPRHVLELINDDELERFCFQMSIKTRGDLVINILENYKDAENLFLENYTKVGFRDLAGLKENGINVKESELGSLFEELTKKIFLGLGFTVDEEFRKQLNTSKDKIDILLKTEDNQIFLVECKSIKESGYNKFSSVSRQLKSYMKLLEKNNLVVTKSILVAPDFSDDFIKDCGLDYELNLSLITSETLMKIMKAYKDSKLKTFPHNLLMRDVLIQEDRVIKAISR
jgi:RecB family endonuclease NucS